MKQSQKFIKGAKMSLKELILLIVSVMTAAVAVVMTLFLRRKRRAGRRK